MDKLGLRDSLKRRWARMEDVQEFVWKPEPVRPAQGSDGGVFGHLRPSQKRSTIASTASVKLTWRKFAETVLPSAVKVEVEVPYGRAPFYGLLTAEVAGAPPILQWDVEEHRNPVSWFLYHGGSTAAQWGIASGMMEVAGIALPPWNWSGGKYDHFAKSAMFILPLARDSKQSGNALFPETLKSELHGIRAVVESYSKSAVISGEGNANGLMFAETFPLDVRVTLISGAQATYRLDRWD